MLYNQKKYLFDELIQSIGISIYFGKRKKEMCTRGLNHLPYLLSTSVFFAVIKDFSTNYMTALGLNQAYTSLKLRNKYNILLICSFRSITGNILQL